MELNPTRFLFMHEVSFRPIKQISVTLHEGVLINSFFDPRFLNPAMIFHSHAAWKEDYLPGTTPASENGAVGSQFGITIDAVPIKRLRIYGQFGMNQFQTPSELKGLNGKNYTPNSLGGLFGLEYVYPTKIGYIISSVEGIYANPWYNILSNKKISYYHERKEMSSSILGYDKSQIYTWISNPYGPDTITAIAQVSLINPKNIRHPLLTDLYAKAKMKITFLIKIKKILRVCIIRKLRGTTILNGLIGEVQAVILSFLTLSEYQDHTKYCIIYLHGEALHGQMHREKLMEMQLTFRYL